MNKYPASARLLIAFLLVLGCQCLILAQNTAKPNVIFILTDDQGYGDLGCTGNPYIKTPFLDALNKESVCFTNFHVGTTCAPSRAGLMSGQYGNKVGAWHTIKGREILSKEVPTVANVFQDAGYKTAIFGKWHLGDSYPFRPQDRGFGEVLIHKGGGIGQSPDYWNNDYFDDTYFHNGKPEKFEGYCTDVWFDNALKFINQNKNQPFFCYLPLNAPHGPFNIADKYSNPYKGNSKIPNANFYGMIANIDENVGKLREKLKELNLDKNTIIVFMTDNGTSSGVSFDKNGQVTKGFNAGMRGTKGSPYEGGHRVPFFIHWSGGQINQHKELDALASYIDFMPTILDLCNIKIPINKGLDGMSLLPLIQGKTQDGLDRFLVVDTQREEFLIKDKDACVMQNHWRFLKIKGQTQLFDLKNDAGQTTDVSAQNPKLVQEMNAAYESWWAKISVNKEAYSRLIIGSKNEKEVTLNTHDCHSEDLNPAWNQDLVRKGIVEHGFWSLEVAKKGKYIIELRRYPKESDLEINAEAPLSIAPPGGSNYAVGKKMNYQKAQIRFGDTKMLKNVEPNQKAIQFEVTLPKGNLDFHAEFLDSKNEINNSYYVYIKSK